MFKIKNGTEDKVKKIFSNSVKGSKMVKSSRKLEEKYSKDNDDDAKKSAKQSDVEKPRKKSKSKYYTVCKGKVIKRKRKKVKLKKSDNYTKAWKGTTQTR